MENSPHNQNTPLLKGPLQRFVDNDPTFRLNRLAQSLNFTEYSLDDSTPNSVVRRRDGKNKITIGTQAHTSSIVERYGMGTTDKNEQILIKLSHELAHAYQNEKGYEKALLDYLNRTGDIPEFAVPYIELYMLLGGIGPVNGLAQESIYAAQSRVSGDLKMEALEDMTELISAYLISDEYFLYRLDRSVTNLTNEVREFIAQKVIEICKELD
jgi:hypothetical protein